MTTDKLGEFIMVGDTHTPMIEFIGCCKVDQEFPLGKFPVADFPVYAFARNDADANGDPDAHQEWLLVKADHPWQTSSSIWPGQEVHFPMMLRFGLAGRYYMWDYLIITEDFEVADVPTADPPRECATWQTKPATVAGTHGLVDFFDTVALVFHDVTNLGVAIADYGMDSEVKAYGIALTPNLWYGGNATCWSEHRIHFRRWMIRPL